MVVQLVVTPEMIKCFHECTAKGNYLQLFEDNEQFFETLKENLNKVNFTEPLYSAIVKEFNFLLNCLSTWVPSTALPWDKETINPGLYLLGFLPRFVLAMQTRNWNDFYKQFLPIIDLMIEAARRQEVIDLKVGFGTELFETDWDGFYEQHRQTADMLMKEARAQELIDLKIEYKGNLYDSFEDRDAPEQQHFNSFIRKYGSNRHYSMLYNENGKRPPINFLRRTLSGVEPDSKLKETTGSTASSRSTKHVTFAEQETEKSESASSVHEVKKIVLTGITEVKESDSTRVTEVKADPKVLSEPDTEDSQLHQEDELYQIECRYQKVLNEQIKKTVPTAITKVPQVKQSASSRATEVRQTVLAAIPKTHESGSTRVPEVRETPNVLPKSQREYFQVNQNEEINRLETRIQKLLAKQLDLIRVETDRKQKNLETRINVLEEHVRIVGNNQKTFEQKLQQMEYRFENSIETKLRKFGANLASEISQNKHEDPTKKLELLEENLQFRELVLHQKIDEIKIREQTLDNRMNGLMELMESKMDNFVEKKFPDESQDDSDNPEEKKIADQTQEDIDFDKKLAEQLLDYEERKMVVDLVITEVMIKGFHSCAKKGDYQPLFKDYSQFFESLTENLCKINFSIPFYSEVVKESKFLLNFISTWVPNTEVPWEKKTSNPNLFILDFFPRLVLAMQTKNWDGFYKRFSPFIDIAIGKARRQRIIDLKIEFRLKVYDTFKLRDEHKTVFSTCKALNCEPSPSKTVSSNVPEDKQTVPIKATKVEEPGASEIKKVDSTRVPEVKESSLAQVPDVKESVPSKIPEVQQIVPAGITDVKQLDSKIEESDPTKAPEVKEVKPTKVSDVKENVPNEKPMVQQTVPTEVTKVKALDSTKVPEVKEVPEVTTESKPENLQINLKEELRQIEARLQKLLTEQLDLIRIETERTCKKLETRIDVLEENLKTMEINQKTIDQKLQEMESRLENAMDMKFKKFGEDLKSTIAQNKNEESTKKLELLEEQLQVRELLLHQKIDEIKIREQTLDNRMNELMELMESKKDNFGEKKFPGEPEEKKIPEKSQEDIDFDKKLAEQLLDYEERLRRIQKKRKEMNEDS
ncbi:unnamed protein product [Caenorhabditis brenneri]